MTPRFANGKYRDCKWCHGRGCNFCEAEADKEYKRQFPDGPKPIATFNTSGLDSSGVAGLINRLMGPAAMAEADVEAAKRAKEMMANAGQGLGKWVGLTDAEAEAELARQLSEQVLAENITKAGKAEKKAGGV